MFLVNGPRCQHRYLLFVRDDRRPASADCHLRLSILVADSTFYMPLMLAKVRTTVPLPCSRHIVSVYHRRLSTATSTACSSYLHPCRSLSDLVHDHLAHTTCSLHAQTRRYLRCKHQEDVFLTSRSSVSCVHDHYFHSGLQYRKSVCIYPGRCWPGIEADYRACLVEGVSYYRPLVHFAAHGIVEVFCLRVEGFNAM